MGGFAAMDPTLSQVASRLPVNSHTPTEGTLLHLWLQELHQQEQQRQRQQRTQLLLSAAAMENDRIRLCQAFGFATRSTPQLFDATNSTTIGHCALALAMARAARNERTGMS
jgi:hypothetical protein